VSRYNDLNGYWALGLFQGFLRDNLADELCFDLLDVAQYEKKPFFLTPLTTIEVHFNGT